MENNIHIIVKTQADKAKHALNGLVDSFSAVSRKGKTATKSIGNLTNGLGGLKRIVAGIGIYKLVGAMHKATKSATDIRESVHMFNVAMGEMAVKTGESVSALAELSGMDKIKMLDTEGEYNLLARSMGMTSDSARILSENTNKLALDLSALTNRDVQQVAEDLRSGLIGQAKTMYKYGVDVTEASIKQEALNQGISKSVRHMSQSEKMGLRYNVMLRQTGLAHGDFATTIDSPANQMRILLERMLTLSRTMGTILMPAVEKLLPVLNALVIVLIDAAKAVATLAGYDGEMEKIENTFSNFGDDSLEDMADDADTLQKKMKDLKSQLMGFDEINLYQDPTALEKADEMDISGTFNLDMLEIDNKQGDMKQIADGIAKSIQEALSKVQIKMKPVTDAMGKLWNEGLTQLGGFALQTLKDFYNSFLSPMMGWLISDEGLIRFYNIINSFLKQIEWGTLLNVLDRLYKSLVPFGKFVFTAALDFMEYFLKPIGVWTFNTAIPQLADALSTLSESVNWGVLNDGLNRLWGALSKLTTLAGDGIVWIVQNALLPLADWSINQLAPKLLEALGVAIETLNIALEALRPTWEWAWDNFFTPLADWSGDKLLTTLDWLIEKLEILGVWIKENPKEFTEIAKSVVKFGTAFFILKPIAKNVTKFVAGIMILSKIKGLMTLVTGALSGLAPVAATAGTAAGGALTGGLMVSMAPLLLLVAKVILVVGIIAGIFYVLYKNWNKVVDSMEPLFEQLGIYWEHLSSIFSTIWETLLKPIFDSMIWVFQYMWYDVIKPIGRYISDIIMDLVTVVGVLGTAWGKRFNFILNVMKPVIQFLIGVFGPIIADSFHAIVSNATIAFDLLRDLFKVFRDVLSGFTDFLVGVFTGDWNMAFMGLRDGLMALFEGVGNFLVAIGNSIIGAFSKVWAIVGGIINGMISMVNSIFGVVKIDYVMGKLDTRPPKIDPFDFSRGYKVPKLAGGGLVDAGQMFIANEAGPEMVGKFGSKTGVVNNEQIVSAITEGVYKAVVSAMRESSGDGGGDVILNLDGREMGRALLPKMNSESKRQGYKPILKY